MPRKLPADVTDYSAVARYTVDMWNDLDSVYEFWAKRWRRTIDYIKGEHWKVLQELERDKLPKWKRFPHVNFTGKLYEVFLAQWLEANVRYSSVPASPDPHDIIGAELMEQVMKYSWDVLEMEQKRVDLGAWVISCGIGYLRFFWDTNTGNMLPLAIPTPDGGMIPVNPDTMQIDITMPEPIMLDQGELGVEVVGPQLVRWGHSKADGVMVGILLSYDEVLLRYGQETADQLSYSKTHSNLTLDISFTNTPATEAPDEERALIIEHYVPRSSRHPNGLWWTATDSGRKLITKPNPLPAGVLPIASFRWVPVPGHRKLGMSPLYDITFPNKAYDERMARILEWQNKVLPKVLLRNGGGLTYGMINDEPAQELVVNAGGEPTVMEYRQVPNSFFTMLQEDQQNIMTLGGFNLTKPDRPKHGALSNQFRVVGEAKESQETKLAQINSKAGWKEAGEIIVKYVANFYTEPRVIAIQGADKQYQWREFSGDELMNVAAHIHVDEASLYPWNREALRDSVIGVLGTDFGHVLLMDEKTGGIDKDRLSAVLNATGLDVSISAIDPDVSEARNEQMLFQNLPPDADPSSVPQPQEWQDHAAHYEEHIKVLKSAVFQSWPEHSKGAYLQHVQATGQILSQQAQQEAEAFLDQERQMREIREQAEVRADSQRMALETMMEVIKPAIMEVFKDAGVVPQATPAEE